MTKSILHALALACFSAGSAATAATVVLPFEQIETVDPFRQTVFTIAAGKIDEPLTQFGTTTLRPATMASVTLVGGSGDPYDPASGRSKFFLVLGRAADPAYYYFPRAAIGELLAGTASGVTLVVGKDTNGDGKPQADEVLCQAEYSESSPGRCIAGPDDLQAAPDRFWFMAVAPAVPGATFSANLSGGLAEQAGPLIGVLGDITSANQTTVSGPASTLAGAAFQVVMTRLDPAVPFHRYYGAVLFNTGATAILPFALEQASAYPLLVDPQLGPLALTTFHTPTPVFTLAPGESNRRLFFDLPASASTYDSIVVDGRVVTRLGSTAAPNLELALVRSDFPPSSQSAVVAAAPDSAAALRWNATANDQDFTAVLEHPQAGRWYIVATNKGSELLDFVANIADSSNPLHTLSGFGRGANPTLVPGNYFNPQRSGHGISISQAAGQQLMFWYSYLQDGTPTWYLAQAPAPAADSGWWASALYRVRWDGSAGTPVQVGYVELVPTAANRLMFTWHLDGESGSEALELLASGESCPKIAGVPTNFAGNWFAPSQPGYGVDVLALPDQQFDVFFFYDAAGTPRWSVGSAPFKMISTLDMVQSKGFCPTCSYTPFTTQALGPLVMAFSNNLAGAFGTHFELKPPLSGSWNIGGPMLRLTGGSTCQ